MTDITQIAADFYTWAARHGILAATALRELPAKTGDPANIPFSQAEADFFRNRPITRIRTDAGTGRSVLAIFTRMIIAERKRQQLASKFLSKFGPEIALEISTAPSYKVDQTLQAYGPFEPIRSHNGRISCGSSIGIGNQRNAGTLTAIAADKDGQYFGLSCNHVVGGCNTALPGTPIVIPGIQDVCVDYPEITVIGKHLYVASMSQGVPAVFDIGQNADLACFELLGAGLNRLSSWQGHGTHGFETPTDFEDGVRKDLEVQKWGRSTGHTRGRISSVLTDPEPVDYNVTSYFGPQSSQTFHGTIYYSTVYEVVGQGGRPFSLGGDSGSLVATVGNSENPPKVVGIVIAGSKDKSLVLPLKAMLEQLGLTLVAPFPS